MNTAQNYVRPDMLLEFFDVEDVVTASSGGETVTDPVPAPQASPSPDLGAEYLFF